jgi:hypothetical protein
MANMPDSRAGMINPIISENKYLLTLPNPEYLCSAFWADTTRCRSAVLQSNTLRVLYFDFLSAFETISLQNYASCKH